MPIQAGLVGGYDQLDAVAREYLEWTCRSAWKRMEGAYRSFGMESPAKDRAR